MGIAKNGIFGGYKGKIGNLVFYNHLEKNVVRTIGNNLSKPTPAQLQCRQELAVMNGLLSNMLEFINTGFSVQARQKHKIPYNLAMSYNKKHALTGAFPEVAVNYGAVVVAMGTLTGAQQAGVVQVAEGLHFTWYIDPANSWPEVSDQAMLLAYFPRLQKAVYKLYGPARFTGNAVLEISGPMQVEYMEIYMAFISADRKLVSNSCYVGSFNA